MGSWPAACQRPELRRLLFLCVGGTAAGAAAVRRQRFQPYRSGAGVAGANARSTDQRARPRNTSSDRLRRSRSSSDRHPMRCPRRLRCTVVTLSTIRRLVLRRRTHGDRKCFRWSRFHRASLAGLSIRPLVYRIDEGLDLGLLWALRHQQTLPPCIGGECTSGTQIWIGRIPWLGSVEAFRPFCVAEL